MRSHWQKSSYSNSVQYCVEIAHLDDTIAARDSKDPHGGVLRMSSAAWSAFLHALRADRFDG
ncbi:MULTISPECIES: DUF397 domain-containing protein [unclassified Saccharopolyspora]|uniref:DUF397 domain-containing protein n=1 Tax=unclassified Saccharopolyspora TaxID=2646250 RepID=UPI001CD53A22|nr:MULTISPECIES: DUF397 domain-containing protein [unclassified Saccharopolyspora]MCA1188069.1 DUF397 domain-containing protein [Saccharopolyspora sp. 6T]MCA1195187.1 DUF397 domain-containing protein [Saccharopolyspora sp. 6V]MCA1225659.1 DUF397 domain-containing protein [Saccharopolyspora sp. 6M]MCA1281250.1 DUF397 domain-containing protein [Saccharopolyspora sp. 7B]